MNCQQYLALVVISAMIHPAVWAAPELRAKSLTGISSNVAYSSSRSKTGHLTGVGKKPQNTASDTVSSEEKKLSKASIDVPQSGAAAVLLPDASVITFGGMHGSSVSDEVFITPEKGSGSQKLAVQLVAPRAGHTATLLPSGSVFLYGGSSSEGLALEDEIFDLVNLKSTAFLSELPRKSNHSATLLTDGRVLISGGVDEYNQLTDDLILWNPKTKSNKVLTSALSFPRKNHTSELQADGTVRIHGGVTTGDKPVAVDEVFDPVTETTQVVPTSNKAASDKGFSVSASIPEDGSNDVRTGSIIAVRFSDRADVRTVTPESIVLSGQNQIVPAKVIPAESGRLAFVTPLQHLTAGTDYLITAASVRSKDGALIEPFEAHFATAQPAATASALASPTNGSLASTAANEDPKLATLSAANGVTALAGQTRSIFGKYLSNILFRLDCDGKKAAARSDATGRFLISINASGHCELEIDGTTVSQDRKDYGRYYPGVDLVAGQTNSLPYTVWLTPIDHAHEVTIPSPTAGETVITHPNLKGLELHLPSGTIIRDANGQALTQLGITPIPVGRPPFPLPSGVPAPIYFTIQPGGSFVEVGGSRYATGKGAQLVYPNTNRAPAGQAFNFWNYDPDGRGWYVYGTGHVDALRRSVIPDPGVVIHRFTGAMVADPSTAPPTGPFPPPCINLFGFTFCLPGGSSPRSGAGPGGAGPGGAGPGGAGPGGGGPGPANDPNGNGPNGPAGDPIDPGTGLFVYKNTDYVLPDVLPFSLTRTYRQGDPVSRSFGVGMASDADILLIGDIVPYYSYQDLVLPDGSRVHFVRTSPGTSYSDAVYQNQTQGSAFYGATIAFGQNDWAGWTLFLRNGTRWMFPEAELQTNPGLAAIQKVQDRYGNTLVFGRDLITGALRNIVTQNGRALTFTLDSSNRITQAKDNLGRTTNYQYDEGGRLIQVTNPVGGVTNYTYDANNQMLSVTDPRGNAMITNAYDAAGRVQQQTLADGSKFTFSYTEDSNGNIVQTDVTNPRGNTRRMTFNTNGYYSSGQMTSEIHALGKTEQQTTMYSWNVASGLLQSVTDPLNRTVTYGYDASANITSVTALAGISSAITSTATYSPTWNQVLTLTDPLNRTVTYAYDTQGNLTKATSPLGDVVVTSTYNSNGQVASVSNAASGTSTFSYSAGFLTGWADALGNHSSRIVDAIGRTTQTTDSIGDATQLQYDLGNRLIQSTDPLGGVTQFNWDANTNLLSLTDTNSNTTSFTYDSLDHGVARKDPLHHSSTATYNPNGFVSSSTDRKGQTTQLTYDSLDRVTQVQYADNSTTSYTYDAGNRVTQIADSVSGTITHSYDNLDRLLSETTPNGSVTYTYNNAGQRTSMTAGNQTPISYSYDGDGRLSTITQGSNSVVVTYDGAGRRAAMTLPNQITASYTYDQASRLTGIAYTQGRASLGTLTYAYDAAGRVIGKGGSLAATGLPSAVSSAVYGGGNQLTQWNGNTLAYDANGSLLSDGSNTYQWDARNRLASISGSSSAAFQYDALGRRQTKVIGSSQTNLLFDGANAVQEQGVDGSVVANVLTGFGLDENLTRTDAAGTHSFLTDALGSTLALVDSSGSFSTQYIYDPFGDTSSSGTSLNTAQYTGRENDGNGLYYLRARYYNPAMYRFISEDQISFFSGTANLFEYSFSNPINNRDPSGNCPFCVGAAVGAVTGGIYGAIGAVSAGGGIGAVAESAAAGVAVGALIGAADTGVVATTLMGAAGSFVGSALTQSMNSGSIDWNQAALAGLAGAAGSAIGGTLGNLAEAAGSGELESSFVSSFVGANIELPMSALLTGLRPSSPKPK